MCHSVCFLGGLTRRCVLSGPSSVPLAWYLQASGWMLMSTEKGKGSLRSLMNSPLAVRCHSAAQHCDLHNAALLLPQHCAC